MTELLLSNIPQSFATQLNTKFASQITFIIGSIISCHKSRLLKNLRNRLKKIDILISKQKKRYEVVVEETHCYEIWINTIIEKKNSLI